MAKDVCDIKVTVTRMIQLNKFEPFTVELEETRSDVSIDKAAKLRSELFNELSAQADKLLKRAIKEYRER